MGALAGIAYVQLLGYPLVFWLGILTWTLLASNVGLMVGRRRPWKFRLHRRLGYALLAVAAFHGLLALSAYI